MNKFYFWCAMTAYLLFQIRPLSAQTPCVGGMAGVYPCDNVDLLAFVPLTAIGGGPGTNTSDIWGWVSPNTGKEYALVGCSYGTAFLDISIPTTPVYLGLLPKHFGTENSLWRDVETYQNYCFVSSEASGHGLQVFDLFQLDNVENAPVDFEETAHYSGFGHCHTINIDVQTGYCYCNGTSTFDGGPHIVDISNPTNPTLAGGFDVIGYTHDSFVWTYDGPDPDYADKELLFLFNGDEFAIADVTDKSDCQLIGNTYTYADLGYVHQGWVTKDKSHFLINDELDEGDLSQAGTPTGTRTHIYDVTNIDNAIYMGFYESTSPSIDHNLYIEDQFVYESNYRSGVRVLDAVHIDDGDLTEVGYFDLFPANDFIQYSGTWSNYPYLPSGVNLATSMYEGFFILQPSLINLAQDNFDLCGVNEIILQVEINAELAFPLTFAVEGIGGVSVTANPVNGVGNATVSIGDLLTATPGTYYATLALQTNFGEQYEVPFTITISNGAPSSPTLINVPNNSFVSNTAPSILFEWANDPNSTSYTFELATDAAFTSIVETQTTALNMQLVTFNLPDGIYYWRVRSTNECGTGQWSAVFSFTIAIVNVIELNAANIQVFPNPATDVIYIQGISKGAAITIYDMSGRAVKNFDFNREKNIQLDISNLAAGSYLIKTGTAAVRWMKQ